MIHNTGKRRSATRGSMIPNIGKRRQSTIYFIGQKRGNMTESTKMSERLDTNSSNISLLQMRIQVDIILGFLPSKPQPQYICFDILLGSVHQIIIELMTPMKKQLLHTKLITVLKTRCVLIVAII